jgi:hypothetical protein
MSIINIATYNPIIEIQDNLIFANNGNIIACYRGELPEIYSLSEKDFEDLHGIWFQALKSLPVGCVIHKQDVYVKKGFSSEYLPNDTFLAKATHDHFKGREYIDHSCYLFLTLVRNKTLNNSKYVNPFRKVSKGIYQELNQNVYSFIGSVNDSITYINNSRKVQFLPLEKSEILKFSQDFLTALISISIPI